MGRLIWRAATMTEFIPASARAKTLFLDVSDWPGHRPGQHVDIRLTAEDGYQAVRSYSIASPPEDPTLAMTVEVIPNGEVSPYLVDVAIPGDQVEVRGPIGGHFVWDATVGGPLLLVAGGSGLVPLLAMIRHRIAAGSVVPIRLLYSVRSTEDGLHREELARIEAMKTGIEVAYTYTGRPPQGWNGYHRRVDASMLQDIAWAPAAQPHIYVCGPTSFVESAAAAFIELGHAAGHVKTERFGPSGT